MSKAPTGAFSLALQQPAMVPPRAQGPAGISDANSVSIARMLKAIYTHETKIRAWEDMSKSGGRRHAMHEGRVQYVNVAQLAVNSLREARQQRDQHIEDVKHAIDYALTSAAYDDAPCSSCQLPADALGFTLALGSFDPAISCGKCNGRGVVRKRKSDVKSEAEFKRVSYFKQVLNDVVLCAKVRAGTSDSNEAYLKLEEANRMLMVKFGNEAQTSLEADDAEQGVRQGIVDAAMRFDPTRPEQATFNTVAYNWCRRNSRARHEGQKRAGVYAPSLDGMFGGGGGGGEEDDYRSMISSGSGAFASFAPNEGEVDAPTMVLDLRSAIDKLPEPQRSVIDAEYKGLSLSEIARRMDLPKTKVRRYRELAFETLRNTLAGYVVHD